ncbi:MAG: membrane protein insertase YidC [Deltaproteobacteria bacterium]|nr:membrane protein insertase YidC [Deltaproteobacteria bacterium]
MEKRMILALVLSFLVLMIWSFLFAPKQGQGPPEREEGIEKREPTIYEPAGTPIPSPAIPPKTALERDSIIPQLEEKEIKVETPLYIAVFSNIGATIKSFKLKKYHLTTDPYSPLVELVNMENSGEDFFRINFDHQSNLNHEKIIYHVNEESFHLDPESPPRDLTFSAVTSGGVSINQTFRIYPDQYPIGLLISLSNNSEKRVEGNLKAYLRNLPPEKKDSYYSFVGVALLLDEELKEIESKKMKEDKHISGRIGWMAYESGHFMAAIIPDDQSKGSFQGRLLPSGFLEAIYITPAVSLESHGQISSSYILYLGPRDLSILKHLDKKLDLAINFGWTDIIAKPLLYALRFFNQYVKNYGISIILLTILIKALFWPLTHKSYKSMKEMQKLQPLMAKLREKYKNDKQQMNKELMALYKTYKVNPMGGCLPMIIQIPVFFALFRILGNSIELRHAPFLFWINDLSAPDRLFNFTFQIPFMSPPYGIPILTLMMGASMFVQQKMTPTPGDPTQAKVMMFLPVIFTVMFINFPSGLVLYWLTNNILSIGQQYRILRSA